MTFLKIILFEVHIAKWIINCQMDKTKFTLGKFSFPVFLQPTVTLFTRPFVYLSQQKISVLIHRRLYILMAILFQIFYQFVTLLRKYSNRKKRFT
jgi:hypothetical protein